MILGRLSHVVFVSAASPPGISLGNRHVYRNGGDVGFCCTLRHRTNNRTINFLVLLSIECDRCPHLFIPSFFCRCVHQLSIVYFGAAPFCSLSQATRRSLTVPTRPQRVSCPSFNTLTRQSLPTCVSQLLLHSRSPFPSPRWRPLSGDRSTRQISLSSVSITMSCYDNQTDMYSLEFAHVLEQLETEFYKQALAKFEDNDFIAAGFGVPDVPKQIFAYVLLICCSSFPLTANSSSILEHEDSHTSL